MFARSANTLVPSFLLLFLFILSSFPSPPPDLVGFSVSYLWTHEIAPAFILDRSSFDSRFEWNERERSKIRFIFVILIRPTSSFFYRFYFIFFFSSFSPFSLAKKNLYLRKLFDFSFTRILLFFFFLQWRRYAFNVESFSARNVHFLISHGSRGEEGEKKKNDGLGKSEPNEVVSTHLEGKNLIPKGCASLRSMANRFPSHNIDLSTSWCSFTLIFVHSVLFKEKLKLCLGTWELLTD